MHSYLQEVFSLLILIIYIKLHIKTIFIGHYSVVGGFGR